MTHLRISERGGGSAPPLPMPGGAHERNTSTWEPLGE